ncbi:TPA: SocA family protein [Enterococcus faecium]|uniref:Panacea domain-containing protein n=1 Tax=Enterococcus faecium TaxID=1352 RepID=UPI0011592E75|nr:Panacea domain-containing protein [Enterococcus faecium]HAQ4405372.1 SocA family protein [Enterococcus faecium]HAQ4408227.1 SocA family protein [Enterococcus faecium]HAQ4419415.1 SocA family protein [Enterococcus faecium]HAQ4424986.1 SocA family protein [Enterococcus faecium]HAQ4430471.1 SocA family protein [Enterococcus faecium]
MRDVNEYAKFFLKKNLDSNPNTFDGNMKLQKLLFFANLINFSKHNSLLFEESMLAFENGTVIEEVRQKYKNDYYSFMEEAKQFQANFSEKEYEVLNDTIKIFGRLSAKDLSNLNHEFDFWNIRFENSTLSTGYHDKKLAKITKNDISKEIYKITEMLNTYNQNFIDSDETFEIINGITFYYNPNEVDFEQLLPQLEIFSTLSENDDDTYSVYLEDGDLVIV